MSVVPNGDRLLLGRGEDCDVLLAGHETSRHHAEVRSDGAVVVIRDLSSTNGVFVNGDRIGEAPLREGDVVRCGEWVAVAIGSSADPAAPRLTLHEAARGLYAGPCLGPILEQVRRASGSDLPIVLVGETGTGKERVAKAIHHWSGRSGSLIGVNCAAIPATLVEAELFGYRKGAFTGAERNSVGHFRAAHGGTLLLDEIGDLPLDMQAKLLRVIEERQVTPLGESHPVTVDVRLLATSQEPLVDAVHDGRFRKDLYARLAGLVVRLPPLRERRVEVPYLFLQLLRDHAGGRPPAVAPRLLERLCLMDLPFNVREIDLLARRLLVLHGHERLLKPSHLAESLADGGQQGANAAATRDRAKQATVRKLVASLRRHDGVIARAAAELGISRQRAYRLLRNHGIALNDVRGGGSSPVEGAT